MSAGASRQPAGPSTARIRSTADATFSGRVLAIPDLYRGTGAEGQAVQAARGFANFAATLGQRTGGAIGIETANGGRRDPVDYPEQGEDSTAGDWNAIAAQNNRVEFRLVPAG